jgi:hypothetical protein
MFGPKRDEIIGDWRKLLNEERHTLYSSPNTIIIIKSGRMRWTGNVARTKDNIILYKGLVGKPEGKRSLGRPRRVWVDNIKMVITVYGVRVWIRFLLLRIETSGGFLRKQ